MKTALPSAIALHALVDAGAVLLHKSIGAVTLAFIIMAEAAVAYVQLFDFSNYTYEAATEIVELRGPRAQKLIAKL